MTKGDLDPVDEEQQLLANITAEAVKGMAGARNPLQAEQVVCSIFGMMADSAAEAGADEFAAFATLVAMLDAMVQHAERTATPNALALLRVLSRLGPPNSRESAGEASSRLAARGVQDVPWARRVGAPDLLRSWVYADVFGQQSSVCCLFNYQGREHVLMVLVDHELGGGIKDCWLAEGREAQTMRETTAARVAGQMAATFQDVDPSTALALLRSALAEPPCPEQNDQFEDVARFAYLAHARAQRIAALIGEPEQEAAGLLPPPPPSDADRDDVLQIKVSLTWAKPPIWRRLQVPAAITLDELHDILQVAFGWDDTHLHLYEVPAPGGRRDARVLEGAVIRRTRLADVAGRVGDRLVYLYDFGDNWEHRIEVEDRFTAEAGDDYPRCTGGRRAAPPEDCGGIPGYEEMLAALADPTHPSHDHFTEWAPEGLDPAAFDRDSLDAALRGVVRTSLPLDG